MADGKCSIEGCERGPIKARGWCTGHYSRWQRHGDVMAAVAIDADLSTPSVCGTSSKYSLGCRCESCSAAMRRFFADVELDADDPRHGTATGYRYGCRCEPCKFGRSRDPAFRRARSRRRARARGCPSEPYTLEEIAKRDGMRCQLCRRKVSMDKAYPDRRAPSIDHVVPLSVGGDDTRTNVQLTHLGCNLDKMARAVGEQLRLVG